MLKPNVVFLLTDQWRLQALGYAGNTQVKTPSIDRLARESISFKHAISGYSVCCPWRASFLTGQYPLTHGVIVNDVPMWRVDTATSSGEPVGLGDAFKDAGYNTAYIGKWHVDGRGRKAYIPPERRLGFDYFKALECTHEYNQSAYYDNDDPTMCFWDGYDVFAQTADARRYIQAQSPEKPFMLVVSWGPPHNPYETAPSEFRDMYDARDIKLRPNVPAEMAADAREWLAGYYAHCSALDKSVGDIMETLDERGLERKHSTRLRFRSWRYAGFARLDAQAESPGKSPSACPSCCAIQRNTGEMRERFRSLPQRARHHADAAGRLRLADS